MHAGRFEKYHSMSLRGKGQTHNNILSSFEFSLPGLGELGLGRQFARYLFHEFLEVGMVDHLGAHGESLTARAAKGDLFRVRAGEHGAVFHFDHFRGGFVRGRAAFALFRLHQRASAAVQATGGEHDFGFALFIGGIGRLRGKQA